MNSEITIMICFLTCEYKSCIIKQKTNAALRRNGQILQALIYSLLLKNAMVLVSR